MHYGRITSPAAAVYNPELTALVNEYRDVERELEVAHYKWRKTATRPLTFCGTGPFRSTL